MKAALPLALAAAALAVAACSKQTEAPTDQGVCWHMAQLPDNKVKFNKLAENVDSVEKCAVALEAMRIHFLGLGGSHSDIIGAYQGQFLFLQPQGIFIGESLTSGRYLLLIRGGDGKLIKPGAQPQE